MDSYFTPDKKKYQNSGNEAVLSLIPIDAKYILDIGCGSGDNARILSNRGLTVDCITISEKEKSIAQNFCNKIYIKNIELGLPPEIVMNKYDVVICSHILEHIAYPSLVLNDIKKILRDNKSILIVALPNFLSYRNRFKIFLGKFDYENSGIMDYTHLRWYTYKSGKKLLLDHGFKIIDISVDGNIPFASYLGFLPLNIKEFIKNNLLKISPGLFGGQFIYTCKINDL